MQKLQSSIFLSHSQIDSFNEVILGHKQSLIMALTLSGPEANFIGKDLSFQIAAWEANNAQALHLQILDLMKTCRLKKLKLQFALSLKLEEQLVLACLGGKIWLKRHQQKELLSSDTELAMVLGQHQLADRLTLLAGNNQALIDKISHEEHLKQKIIDQSLTAAINFHYREVNKSTVVKDINKKKHKIFQNIKKIKEKIKLFYQKIKNLNQKQKKRLIIIFLIFFSFIIGLLIAWQIWQQQQNQKMASLKQQVENLTLSEAELLELGQTQPILAREKVAHNQLLLEELLDQTQGKNNRQLLKLAIEKNQAQADRLESENNLDRLSVYYDWRQSQPNFLGQQLLIGEQGIVVSNPQSQKMLWLNNQQVLAQQEFNYQAVSLDLDNDQLALFSKNAGLKHNLWGEEPSEIKTEGDSDRDATLMASYQNYLYLFNPEKRNIYRYTWTDGELSEAIGWLIDKQGINFENASDLSVNGDLWLTFNNGQVMKFSRGQREDFSFKGISEIPKGKVLVSSRENLERVVFLDKDDKKILVTTLDGQIISEIKNNELAGVSDIELAQDGQSVFALSGSVIYQIQL